MWIIALRIIDRQRAQALLAKKPHSISRRFYQQTVTTTITRVPCSTLKQRRTHAGTVEVAAHIQAV